MQISVVVATIQMRYLLNFIFDCKTLKTVVEKVSLRVALMQGLVSPKRAEKSNILSSYDRRKRESG